MASQAPEFAEVEEDYRQPLLTHLELLGEYEGIDLYLLRDPFQQGDGFLSRDYWPGIYWWDEYEWLRLPVGSDAQTRRSYLREMRNKAAELAAPQGSNFTEVADQIFRFLVKE